MNLKELIFGKGASSGGEGGVYRDSIQAWLAIQTSSAVSLSRRTTAL